MKIQQMMAQVKERLEGLKAGNNHKVLRYISAVIGNRITADVDIKGDYMKKTSVKKTGYQG